MTEISDRAFGQLEGKVDGIAEILNGVSERLERRELDFETRLRAVERKQYRIAGAAVAVTFFLAKVDFTQIIAIIHRVA